MGCEAIPSDVTVDYGSTNSAQPQDTLIQVSRLIHIFMFFVCMFGFLFMSCLVALILLWSFYDCCVCFSWLGELGNRNLILILWVIIIWWSLFFDDLCRLCEKIEWLICLSLYTLCAKRYVLPTRSCLICLKNIFIVLICKKSALLDLNKSLIESLLYFQSENCSKNQSSPYQI